ncbi:MAG: NosD domain-containing protein [Candidatus Bathyarchaeales archaeon]
MKAVSGIMLAMLFVGIFTFAFNSPLTKSEKNVQLLLKTDKDAYRTGENVTIILLNVGNETVLIGGYPAWQIFTYPEEKPVYPRIFAFLTWSLNSGENDTFVWNQYNDFNETFCGPGTYVVKDTQGWGLSAYFKIISANIIVPDDYPTIQEAINAASSGDTIYVKKGIYYEHVFVNKRVSLVGENRNGTIIDGNGTGTVVYITADDVSISQLTIRNGYHIPHVNYGIKVHGCNNVIIKENIISKNDVGIFLYHSDNNIVEGNLVFDNWQGVGLTFSDHNYVVDNYMSANEEAGISMGSAANNNTIYNNEINDNGFCGIHIGWSTRNEIVKNVLNYNGEAGIRLDSSDNNRIVGNHLALNTRDGIVLFGSNFNTIMENEIIRNQWDGIALWYSNSNKIYHNNLLENGKQAGSYSGSINTWDDDYPSGGNYWSDYNGTDLFRGPNQNETGSDGIGDTPYVIDEYNRDRYPLMEPRKTVSGNLEILEPANGSTIAGPVAITFTIENTGDYIEFLQADSSNRIDLEIEYRSSGGEIYAWGIMFWSTSYCGLTLSSGEKYEQTLVYDPSEYEGSVPPDFVGDAPYGQTTIRLVHWKRMDEGYGYGEFGVTEINVTLLPPETEQSTVSISPLSASILVGQSVTFTSTVSGGYAPYTYQWYLNDAPVSGATSETWTFTPTTSGIYYVYLKVTDAKGSTIQSETARITVTAFATATIDINPKALNLRSKGKWITAYIELPEGYNVADINVSSIMLNDIIPAEPKPIATGDYNNNGVQDLMVKFNRAEVISYILSNVNITELIEERFMTVTLTVTGYLSDGTPFQGSITIKIVLPMPRGLYRIFLI